MVRMIGTHHNSHIIEVECIIAQIIEVRDVDDALICWRDYCVDFRALKIELKINTKRGYT